MLGSVGSLALLVSLVACLGAVVAYAQASRAEVASVDASGWKRLGSWGWTVSGAAAIAAMALLFYLLLTHQYQYAYVYQYSSNDLKLGYLVSTLWAGQEGSFLLWIVLNVFLGWSVLKWAPASWRAPVMAVVALCQAFLVSMIVGVKFGGNVHIGSSPFDTLAARFPQAPMLQVPGFVPPDGQGLNDLLQNPWMVIHPPTLFTGFAAMLAPFAFAVAALWQRRYTEWIRPALPWMLMAVLILGIGITLGGYWAYVTLSFGGYWAWDPVENSSFVPWLVGVAGLHAMLVYKKSGAASKSALVLAILAFMTVVYSTFLTRSGILGDLSVHSFVDLGLSGQLLIWILTMTGVAAYLLAVRWKEIPRPEHEAPPLSREFLTFTGAMLLVALASAILLGTSAPIFGRIFRDDPAGVPMAFYNQWSLPLTIAFTMLVAVGQLLWWNRMTVEQLNRVVFRPLLLAVVSTLAVMFLTPFVERSVRPAAASGMVEAGLGAFWGQHGMGLGLLLLVLMAFFALYGNAQVAWRIGRGNPKLVGGALAHVGLAITLLGIVASSGFSRALGGGGGVEMAVLGGTSRDNFVLTKGETREIGGYTFTYTGATTGMDGHPAFQLDAKTPGGNAFTVRPVAYQNKNGQWIQHPDVQPFFSRDLFTAVSPAGMFETPDDSLARRGELELRRGTGTTLGDNEYKVAFVAFETNVPLDSVRGVPTDSVEVAVAARLDVTNVATGQTRTLRPIYLVTKGGAQRFVPAPAPDWGVAFAFTGMNVATESAKLLVEGVEVMPKDWIVVQAIEKPLISLVWIGIALLTLGFLVAFVRRIGEVSGRKTLATT